MEYTFIKLKYLNHNMTIVDPTGKKRYICFESKPLANKTISQISEFRALHGMWPDIDLSKNLHKLESPKVQKKRSKADVAKLLYTDTLNEDELLELMKHYYIPVFYCTQFELNYKNAITTNLQMSGQEFDINEEYTDDSDYRRRLELTLNLR